MGRKLQLAGIVAGMFAGASAAHAAAIATYAFTPSNAAPTGVATNVTASNVTFGTSVNTPIYSNDYYATKPVVTLSRKDNTAAQTYFQVTVTAAAGYELNLDNFTFDGSKGGASGPRTYEVHSSVAGLLDDASTAPTATSLTSGAFAATRGAAGSTGAMDNITTDLSAPAYDHLSTLTMRVYFATPTVSQNIDLDNFTFNGSVVAVNAPEPVSAVPPAPSRRRAAPQARPVRWTTSRPISPHRLTTICRR